MIVEILSCAPGVILWVGIWVGEITNVRGGAGAVSRALRC